MMMVLVVLKGSCSVLVAATPTQSRSSNSDTSMMVRGELVIGPLRQLKPQMIDILNILSVHCTLTCYYYLNQSSFVASFLFIEHV